MVIQCVIKTDVLEETSKWNLVSEILIRCHPISVAYHLHRVSRWQYSVSWPIGGLSPSKVMLFAWGSFI